MKIEDVHLGEPGAIRLALEHADGVARFAKPPALDESAFVAADPAMLAEILCIEEERVVARDNTVAFAGRRLQLPQSPLRAHYVKARVKVRQYPDGTLAVFHGPRRLARYDADGVELVDVPTASSVTPCSPPSRRGLATQELVAPTATASLDGGCARRPAIHAGRDEETATGSNKETGKAGAPLGSLPCLIEPPAGPSTASDPAANTSTRSGQLMCYQNRTT